MKVDITDFKYDAATKKLYAQNYLSLPPVKNDSTMRLLSDIKAKQDLNSGQKTRLEERAGMFELGKIATSRDEKELEPENKLDLSSWTGALDSVLYEFTRKLSTSGNNSKKIEARQAFQQYNAVMRKLLSGVAVNPAELKNLRDAYGSDVDTLPILLNSLKASLKSQAAQINVVYNDHPLLTHAIMGDQMLQLKRTIDNINKSLSETSDDVSYKPIDIGDLIPALKSTGDKEKGKQQKSTEPSKSTGDKEKDDILNDLLG